ncbi:MAG: DNRLRE domain-containing protein, partial [Acidobacteriota bacterium]|nr:DNRLRE domain-containing protein [Acidobacteriota bacterium]
MGEVNVTPAKESKGRTRTTLLLGRTVVVTVLAALVAFTAPLGAKPRGVGNRDDLKFDRQLLQRVERDPDASTAEKVIVRLRPGARRGIIQRLRAQGATVTADLAVIEAVAARLPRRMLRRLAQDRDVLSISTDAPVRSHGLSSAVTGTAENGGYSLRRTLGLETSSATTTTVSYQQGVNGYGGTVDGSADFYSPSSAYPNSRSVWVEGYGVYPSGMLLRFDNLVGTGAGQIPPGATVTSASLQVQQTTGGPTSGGLSAYRVVTPWDDKDSWMSMATSGPGLQFDGVEAASAADASVGGLGSSGTRTLSGSGLKESVQAWVNSQPNNGWILFQNTSNALKLATSEHWTTANRPKLTVTYQAPVSTTTLTGAGVTIAVVDSGLTLSDGTARVKTSRDFTTGNPNPPNSEAAD